MRKDLTEELSIEDYKLDLENRIRNLLYDIQCAEQTRHKLEFQILQNQINPHFLHNTLNTIRYMAYVQKEENIVTVVDSLSVLLRNNMRANEYLTIEEEAQSLRSYLEIQTLNTAENTSIQLRLSRD